MSQSFNDLIEIIQFTEGVSSRIHGLLDEAEIYRVVKEEFVKSKEYDVAIFSLTEDRSKVRVAETSIHSDRVGIVEKLTGLGRMKDYMMDLDRSSILSKVVREGKTVQANVRDILSEFFPRTLAHAITKIIGYENVLVIVTPLMRHDEITGALAVCSTELAEYFIPSVRNLATYISTELELAYANTERIKMEEELKERAELLDVASDSIFLRDFEGNILYANEAAYKMGSYSKDEFLKMKIQDLTAPEYAPLIEQREKELMEKGEATWEFAHIRKDKSIIPIESHARLIEVGERKLILNVARDITRRKQRDEVLRESEEKFRSIAERSFDIIFTTDLEGRVTYFSPAVERVSGRSPEELTGRNFIELLSESEISKVIQGLAEVTKGGHAEGIQSRIIRKDGSLADIEVNASPIIREGKLVGTQGIIRDITERKKAEEQLRQVQEYLQLQIDRMPTALIVWDTKFRVKTWNPTATRVFGFSEKEALGKHPYDFIVPKQAQPQVDEIWSRLLEGDETAHSENENITKDGRTIICSWTNTPLRKDDGTVIGVLSMTQDITESKKMEERLIYLNQMLHSVNRVNQLIVKEKDRDRLLKSACEILVKNKGYYSVCIALFGGDGKLLHITHAGTSEYIEAIERGELPICGRKALEQPDVYFVEDTASSCADCPLSKHAPDRSRMTYRLEFDGRVYGLLTASLPKGMVKEEEKSMLKELADDIAYVLNTMEAEEHVRELVYRIAGVVQGECYLSESHDMCLKTFVDLTLHNVPGQCFVREDPERLVKDYNLDAQKVFLLSSRSLGGFKAFDNLQDISLTLSQFLKESGAGVVLLDGLEYLISHFDFNPVYKMLQEKRFDFLEAKAVLLIPITFETLSSQEKALLLTELKILK